MSRRKFVKILGVKIPLDTLASVTSTPSYRTYLVGKDAVIEAWIHKDLKMALGNQPDVFKALAESSKRLPVRTGLTREIFHYEP